MGGDGRLERPSPAPSRGLRVAPPSITSRRGSTARSHRAAPGERRQRKGQVEAAFTPGSRLSARPVGLSSPIINREEAVDRLAACRDEVRALGVARLALFGSVLRGHANVASDVDILVEFMPGAKSYDRFLALSELLECRLGRRVELVTVEALSPFIGPRILAEAQDVLRAA